MSLIIVCLCFHAYVCVCLTLALPSNVLSLLRSSPKSALSARWLHKQFQDFTLPITVHSSKAAVPLPFLTPLPHSAHSDTCLNLNASHCWTAEMKSTFNGDFNSFNSPIISLIARTQILLLLLLNRVRFLSPSLPLPPSLTLQKFTPVDYLKTNFSFRFCPVRLSICVCAAHTHVLLCVSVCKRVCECVCVFVAATEINI